MSSGIPFESTSSDSADTAAQLPIIVAQEHIEDNLNVASTNNIKHFNDQDPYNKTNPEPYNNYWNGYPDSLYANSLVVAQYCNGGQPLYQTVNPCYLPSETWRVINSGETPFVITQQQEKNPGNPSKASLFLWISVLLLLASTIVILPILAISKMHSVSSSGLKFAHKYNGRMIITEGSLLHFDGLVLQTNSEEFAVHARKFARALDSIFIKSVYKKKYAGSEVRQFRLLPKVPAMEVLFTIRLGHGLDLDPYDLTLMLRKYISTHGFDGNSVDENSITIAENKQ